MKVMNSIITVMKFTMKDMIRKKSFIIGTIIILLLIVIGFNIPKLIKVFKGNNENTRLTLVDNTYLFEDKLPALKDVLKDYEIEVSHTDTVDTIKEKLDNGDIDMGIVIENENDNINLVYVVDNVYFFSQDNLINDYLIGIYKNIQIEKLDLDEYQKADLNRTFSYDIVQSSEEAKGNIVLMMALSMFLFYAVYFCAFQVSSSVTTEKTSKIIETLVTSTKPSYIIIGKTLGIGLVGLCQVLLIILTAYASANLFMDPALLDEILDISSFTFMLGVLTIVYFFLGYFVFAFIYALTGSTVSKPEDIQSANTPVAFIALAGFYLSYYTIMNPNSGLGSLASMLPISSPFYMPFRYMMGLASTGDVLLSLFILIISIIIISKIAIKIYSNAILNNGSRVSVKTILSMYKQNN